MGWRECERACVSVCALGRGDLGCWRNPRQHENYLWFCFSALRVAVLCWMVLCWALNSNPVTGVLLGSFFLFGCFYNDKGKIPVWKQYCALFWSITQNRFRLSCSVISTGITHLQACFMPWWWWLYFFKRSVILFVIWNMLSVCIRRSEKKGQNYFLI